MREFLLRVFGVLNDARRATSSPMTSLERSIAAAHHADVLCRLRASAGLPVANLIESNLKS